MSEPRITKKTVAAQPAGGTLIAIAIDHWPQPGGRVDHTIRELLANGALVQDRRAMGQVLRMVADQLDPPGPQIAVATQLPPNGH